LNDSSSEDDNDTHNRCIRQVLKNFLVEEAYCQGCNHYHIGEIAEHMQQMAIGPYATDYRPSNDADKRAAETNALQFAIVQRVRALTTEIT